MSVFNSLFKMISHLQGNFFVAIFFDHDGVFPGRMKFYFPDPTPQLEISWYNFTWSRRRIPWMDEVLFSGSYSQRKNFLGDIFLGLHVVFSGK